jgi:Mg2+ and Co2+ transporter CorA
MLESIETYTETIANAGGTYLTRVNIRASEASNAIAEAVKIFGAVSSIALPFGFVAGSFT